MAQGEVIAEAIAASGVDPRAVSYLEAHGTGTSLGDPIEIAGLQKAFRQAGGSPDHLAIGSVKSNIGHCESAAGIAAVTKVLLQLRHGELVPSLHSAVLNPHIPLEVQFDEHKLLIAYGQSLREFEEVFASHGIRCNEQMKFITEGEHVHSSSDTYARQFEELLMRLGMDGSMD